MQAEIYHVLMPVSCDSAMSTALITSLSTASVTHFNDRNVLFTEITDEELRSLGDILWSADVNRFQDSELGVNLVESFSANNQIP